MARPGRPPRYDTDAEARVTALACSAPPVGRQRWTMAELERAARREPGLREATRLLRRVQFHYTPKHASWLNMAEIEIGILSRQCLHRRIACGQSLRSEVAAWRQGRNAQQRTIEWKFTRQDVDEKLES